MAGPRVVTIGLAFIVAAAGLVAQDRPLPDQQAFLQETRKHLQTDSALQSSYVYVETRRERKLDKQGRTTEESVKVFESHPGLPGKSRWERLVSENGRPVPKEKLAKQDRERQKHAAAMVQRLADDAAKERARQQRDYQKSRRERDEAVSDIFTIFDIRMLGREQIEQHETIAFSLTPKPDARPRTREGIEMKHFKVKAWISEGDYELVKLDAEAIDTLSFGLGVAARLHKGAELSFLRRKVNGEVWLPASISYQGSARVGLLFTLRRAGTSEYSDYRKYSVETSSTLNPPK